jgi:hypothetical protein
MAEAVKLGRANGTADQRSPRQSGAEQPGAANEIDQDIQARIGRQLRSAYDEVVNEPIPERFLRLLVELERKRSGSA